MFSFMIRSGVYYFEFIGNDTAEELLTPPFTLPLPRGGGASRRPKVFLR